MEELDLNVNENQNDNHQEILCEELNLEKQENYNTEETIIKEFFIKDTGVTLKDMAVLFGQTEEGISKEFGAYKAKKLFTKMDYVIDDPSLSNDDFKNKCQLALKYAF